MSEIDARDFGKLEAQVEDLKAEVYSLAQDVKTLIELANKSKGGFLVVMTIASSIGGLITFIAEKLFK